jgi:hypothetical protein
VGLSFWMYLVVSVWRFESFDILSFKLLEP